MGALQQISQVKKSTDGGIGTIGRHPRLSTPVENCFVVSAYLMPGWMAL